MPLAAHRKFLMFLHFLHDPELMLRSIMIETKARGQRWSDSAGAAPPVHWLELASSLGSLTLLKAPELMHQNIWVSLLFLEQLLVPVTQLPRIELNTVSLVCQVFPPRAWHIGCASCGHILNSPCWV